MSGVNGWVHVVCGPMFSGKTNLLIQKVVRAQLAGQRVIIYRPNVDSRTTGIMSRSGLSMPNATIRVVEASMGFFRDVINESDPPDLIVIDEAQFFGKELPISVNLLADSGYNLLIAGLDRDFMCRPFGSMPELLVSADEVTKLTAICHKCKGEATLTQRLINGSPAPRDAPVVYIGGMGDDRYEARCRAHHEVM